LDALQLGGWLVEVNRRQIRATFGFERQIVDAITAARAKNVAWQRIGELLGTSALAGRRDERDLAEKMASAAAASRCAISRTSPLAHVPFSGGLDCRQTS
jgi:hypothetical protein